MHAVLRARPRSFAALEKLANVDLYHLRVTQPLQFCCIRSLSVWENFLYLKPQAPFRGALPENFLMGSGLLNNTQLPSLRPFVLQESKQERSTKCTIHKSTHEAGGALEKDSGEGHH